MISVWNMPLVIMTFFLTMFVTFMTRSGIVPSVHACGQSTTLTYMFTGFMGVLLVFSFGLGIYRLPLLRARNELESWVSREAAFLVNNWILLFSAVFVLFATMFPTLSEAVTGDRLTVGPPFFTKWMLPIGSIFGSTSPGDRRGTLTVVLPRLMTRSRSLAGRCPGPVILLLPTGWAAPAGGCNVTRCR